MSLSTLLLLSGLAATVTHDVSQLEAFQQQAIAEATQVTFASPEQARAAAISLHHALLAGDWKTGQLILQLDAEEQARLRPYAVQMEPAIAWQQSQQTALLANISATAQQGIPGFSCYETVEETYDVARQLVNAYPQYASFEPIGSGWAKTNNRAGYDIYVLKLSKKNDKPNKPKLLINSAIHAREYTTAATALQFARELLNGIGKDADIDWMLEHHEVHLVLQTNPEGRKIAETGILWRKNINDQQCSNGNYGVDLNRNFSFGWNAVANNGGSSNNSCDNTYRGLSRGSEPEVQALERYVRSIFPDRRGPARTDAAPADTSGMHIDLHSYSELVLWPWGENNTVAPNGVALQTLGRKLAFFNDYTPTQSVGLYPTDGTSDGVSYGELGVAAITFEMGTAFFQACSTFQQDILPRNLPALKYALRVVQAPYILPAGPDVVGLSSGVTALAKNRQLTLSLQATDRRFNQLNGIEASQNIQGVAVYIDQFPLDADATPLQLNAKDGQFDSNSELIEYAVDGANLSLGRHTLYFRATDQSGQIGPIYAKYIDIVAPTPRKVNFTAQCQYLQCQFTDSSEKQANETLSYLWRFPDNQTSTSVSPQFTFSAPGNYSVSLQVSDGVDTAELSKVIQVFAQPNVSITAQCDNLNCQFTANATSANGAINQYLWTINNVIYQGAEQRYSFPQAGTYPIQLAVSDSAQQQASTTLSVTVSSPPVVTPPVTPPPVTPPVTPPPVTPPAEPTAPTETNSGGVWHYGVACLLLVGYWRRRLR